MAHSQHIEGRDIRTGAGIVLAVRHGCIQSCRPTNQKYECWLSPGLVDLQVNGYRGFDLNEDAATPATVSRLVRRLLAAGVTTFLPTLVTASREQLLARLSAIAEARRIDPMARACIPFVHMEGPHISPNDGYRGAHPRKHVRPPSMEEFALWQQSSGGLVGMVTLSPHFPGIGNYIRALRSQRVHVSLGHTHATAAQIHAAVQAGAAFSTHLGNGISARIERHNNPLWSQLAESRLTAMLIGDGHHLPADVLKAMLRAKSTRRCILVSDLVALGGMPPGRYSAPIGGAVELSADGRLTMAGTAHLAGAVLPLIEAVGVTTRLTGLSLRSVLRMATLHPARVARQGGDLDVGRRADILQFHWHPEECAIRLRGVWLAGEPVRSVR